MRIVVMLVLLAAIQGAKAVTPDDTFTRSCTDELRSLSTRLNDVESPLPILQMGSNDKLSISFDCLTTELYDLRYEVLPCDASWKIEPLSPLEFMGSSREGIVDDYEWSKLPSKEYVHYSIEMDKERMLPTMAGNYVVRIYDNEDRDYILAQVRFALVEPEVSIEMEASSNTIYDTNKSHQQLRIIVRADERQRKDFGIMGSDMRIVISRNDNTQEERILERPTSMINGQYIYENMGNLVFDGGNEYLRFENVSIYNAYKNVDKLSYVLGDYTAVLSKTEPRDRYVYDKTQHGGFVIRDVDVESSDTDGEYARVLFCLESPLMDNQIMIDGEAFRRLADQSALIMNYDNENQCYVGNVLLKHGAYDYRYMMLNEDGEKNSIEPSFYQTRNKYQVRAYAKRLGERKERLVGVGNLTFGE